MNYLNNKLYDKSNKIDCVRLNKFSKSEYKNLLNCGEHNKERYIKGQILLNYLCDKFGVPRCLLSVPNKPQLSKGNGKTLGRYFPKVFRIEVFNLTAKTHKAVSIKSFADTLLHEFIHHYDIECLGFDASPHTSGFYKRIADLKAKLQ